LIAPFAHCGLLKPPEAFATAQLNKTSHDVRESSNKVQG